LQLKKYFFDCVFKYTYVCASEESCIYSLNLMNHLFNCNQRI